MTTFICFDADVTHRDAPSAINIDNIRVISQPPDNNEECDIFLNERALPVRLRLSYNFVLLALRGISVYGVSLIKV